MRRLLLLSRRPTTAIRPLYRSGQIQFSAAPGNTTGLRFGARQFATGTTGSGSGSGSSSGTRLASRLMALGAGGMYSIIRSLRLCRSSQQQMTDLLRCGFVCCGSVTASAIVMQLLLSDKAQADAKKVFHHSVSALMTDVLIARLGCPLSAVRCPLSAVRWPLCGAA